MLICKSCKQVLNTNKINNVILMRKHIYNENKFFFVMALKRLKECLVAHQMAFAQIYQLNCWSQYGIQARIINVLANVDKKIQTILPQLATCESIIVFVKKEKRNTNLLICQVMCNLKS